MKLEKLIHQRYPLKWKGSSRRWMVPLAGEPSSLVVDTKHQRFFWYSRGLMGGTYVWRRDVCGMSDAANVEATDFGTDVPEEPVKVAPPMRLARLYHDALVNFDNPLATAYVTCRGIGKQAAVRFFLGCTDDYGGAISIPYFTYGKLTGIKLRLIHDNKEGSKYRAVSGSTFGVYNYHPDYRVIVEGEFKAIHLWQIGIDAMSIPAMGFRNDSVRELLFGKRYLYIRDNDTAGLKSAVDALTNGFDLVVTSTPNCKAIDDYILKEGVTSWLQGLKVLMQTSG
jgi:hypothetical protein